MGGEVWWSKKNERILWQSFWRKRRLVDLFYSPQCSSAFWKKLGYLISPKYDRGFWTSGTMENSGTTETACWKRPLNTQHSCTLWRVFVWIGFIIFFGFIIFQGKKTILIPQWIISHLVISVLFNTWRKYVINTSISFLIFNH